MQKLSDAIDKFSGAAERLDRAVEKAVRRAAARADGAEAQGDVIIRLREEIVGLKKALQEAISRPAARGPAEPARSQHREIQNRESSTEAERIEPAFASG